MTDIMIVTAFKDPNMTATKIATIYGVSDTHAINTFARYVDMPQRQLTEAICIDEVHVDINYQCKYAGLHFRRTNRYIAKQARGCYRTILCQYTPKATC